jgi:pimeloyl-ACP methyl ester carboxylesterase
VSEQFSVAGVPVFVEGEGDETIVMVHGWPDTYRLWDAQVAALRSRYKCVRFTLPGFEPGSKRRATPHVEMLAVFKNIVEIAGQHKPVTLMLHDWGCIFGYQFAMVYPRLVKRIIGCDIGDVGSKDYRRSLTLKDKMLIFGYQSWLALAWRIGGGVGDGMTRFMARALRARSNPQYITSAMNYPYDIVWTGSHGSYKGFVPFKVVWPMLFIYGERKIFMFHSSQWLSWLAARPGSAVHGLPSGHWMMVSQRERFNQIVLDWLAEADAAVDQTAALQQ